MNFSFPLLKNSFNNIIRKNIVQRFYKKKSVFEQHHLNPYHLPPVTYKKRVPKFDTSSETINWPPEVTESTPLYGRALILQLEKEEKEKKLKDPEIKNKDRVQMGDKIELEYYMSLTNKKTNKYTGMVIGTRRLNSLTYSFRMLFTLDGYGMAWDLLYHSPMIASIKVIEKSSIKTRRKKIYHYRNIVKMGTKVLELLKGGKSMNLSKRTRLRAKEKNVKIKSGVMEE
jgi:ribosomal protein L19